MKTTYFEFTIGLMDTICKVSDLNRAQAEDMVEIVESLDCQDVSLWIRTNYSEFRTVRAFYKGFLIATKAVNIANQLELNFNEVLDLLVGNSDKELEETQSIAFMKHYHLCDPYKVYTMLRLRNNL